MEKEKLNLDEYVFSEDSFEDLLDNLPEIFEKYDAVEFLHPLNDEEFRLLENLEIPEWKTLYINPTEISFDNLSRFKEFFEWTPWLKLRDCNWNEFDLKKFLIDREVIDCFTGDYWKKIGSNGEIVDPDAYY